MTETETRRTRPRPLFSVLHTSARPDKWREIYQAWIKAAYRPEDVEYVLCVDQRWGFTVEDISASKWEYRLSNGTWGENLNRSVFNRDRRCYVDGVNTAARSSSGQILVVNADDQWPMQGWDSALYQAVLGSGRGLSQEFVVGVSTGTPDEHDRGGNPIIVMPVLSRARYVRLGYVFYTDYESMFADNDLHDHAVHDGVLIQAHHLMFPHAHPMIGEDGHLQKPDPAKWDLAYQEQNRKLAYQVGQVILSWRRRIRFGDALKEAEQLEGWMLPSELSWLSRTASQMDTVVEIGSWKGKSTYAICSGTVGNVYAVDRWNWRQTSEDSRGKQYQMVPAEENPPDVYDDFVRNVVNRFPNVLAVRKDSVEAAKTLPDADMVFIDGGHDYEQVKADIQAWLPKTKRIICGHDYSLEDPGHAGVVRAVNELLGPAVQVKPGTTIWYKDLTGDSATGAAGSGSAIIPNGKTIAWCLPGELFHGPMVQSILKLYGYLLSRGYYVVVHQTWTSSPYVTREALRLSVMDMPVKPDYVLWTDDDNPVSQEIFERLLKDLESSQDIPSVAGWTWVDMFNGSFAVSAGIFTEDKSEVRVIPPIQINSETKLIEVEWHGFPVVLMRYQTLVDAGDKPFAGIPAPNSRWGITGEDVAFCANLKARSGCRLFVDPVAFVPHLKFGAIGPDGRHQQGATVEELSKI